MYAFVPLSGLGIWIGTHTLLILLLFFCPRCRQDHGLCGTITLYPADKPSMTAGKRQSFVSTTTSPDRAEARSYCTHHPSQAASEAENDKFVKRQQNISGARGQWFSFVLSCACLVGAKTLWTICSPLARELTFLHGEGVTGQKEERKETRREIMAEIVH
jgi:hypothetical protein